MARGGRVLGLGHDLQALAGLEAVEALWEPGSFFTEREVERFRGSRSPRESLAGAFSSKEALFKALPPLEGWFWTDAEVLHDERHAPRFCFHGRLREHLERRGWSVLLSITHSGGFVSTVVLVTEVPVRFEESVLKLRVRPGDLDTVGHVNHATALEYLEAGRWAWMDAHGLRRIPSIVGVVARLEVDYRREILVHHEVEVRTRLEEPGPASLEGEEALHYRLIFAQQVLVGGQVAVEARVHVGFVRMADRTLATVQDFMNAAREP
jgi:phosphopantetheine--protein transferase-like protein